MLGYYEIKNKKLTTPNKKWVHEIDGRIRNWHGDSADGVLGIFDFGKGNSFGCTLIYEKRKQHRDELTRAGKVASA